MKTTVWIPALLLTTLATACGGGNTGNPPAGQEPPAGVVAPAESGGAAAPAAAPESGPAAAPAAGTASRPAAGGGASAPTAAPGGSGAPAASAATATPAAVAPAAPAAPAAPTEKELTLPAGTVLPLELTAALSSETAEVEAPVRARLRQALVVDGTTVLPQGTVLTGTVTEVERSGRVRGKARLAFRFTEATVRGAREDVRTNAVVYEAEGSGKSDATKIGGGAIGGAIIGGILGGGKGAAKGAAIGGAGGTGVVLATRGKEVELASGANLSATLARPATIVVPLK